MLLLLFATVIGIVLLNITKDPKPTPSMLGDSVIEAEVKKEIIPEPVIEEVIEAEVKKEIIPEPVIEEVIEAKFQKEIIPEPVIEEVIEPKIKTDPSELESAPKAIGVISKISQPLDKYYLIVASFLDNDLAFDYAQKLILSGSNVIVILDSHVRYFTRVALLEYETFDKANVGLDKHKDEFDEQLWILKY